MLALTLARAESDDASAHWDLGTFYLHGIDVTEDHGAAMRHYRLAHKFGHPYALGSIGKLYESGRGVPQDERKAFECYMEAVRGKDTGAAAFAARDVCRCYAQGIGVDADRHEAKLWHKRSLELIKNSNLTADVKKELIGEKPPPFRPKTSQAEIGGADDLYITDKDGTRHYESETQKALWFCFAALIVEIAAGALASWFQIDAAVGIDVIVIGLTCWIVIVNVPILFRLRRERSYRELDLLQAMRLRPEEAEVMSQQPHGGANGQGLI